MNTFRLIRRSAPQISSRDQFLRYSRSFPSFPKPRFLTHGFDGESAAFHHARLFRKPLSTKYSYNLANTVSLMGFVDRPIRVADTESDSFGVFTALRVEDPRNKNRSFRIPISIWGVMAHKCNAHLKLNDHILVSGRLFTYSKRSSNENSGLGLDCQVRVTEVNYLVPPRSDVVDSQTPQDSKSETVSLKKAREEESKNDVTYLWQVFFANPYEWWDNRKDKKNPRQPDFKHKDTGEALWLDSRKPDWVSRQLELFDQRNADKRRYVQEHTRSGCLSDWL